MEPNWTQPARKQVHGHGGCSDLHPRTSEVRVLLLSIVERRLLLWCVILLACLTACHTWLISGLSRLSSLSLPPGVSYLEGNLDYGLLLDRFYKSVSKPLFLKGTI